MAATTPEIERLRAARPASVDDLSTISPPAHRQALLDSIMAAEAVPIRRRRGPVVVAATVAAVSAAILATDVSGRADHNQTPPRSAAPEVLVLDRIKLAVAAGEGGVVRIETDPGNGVTWEMWIDETAGVQRHTSRDLDGRPLYDHEITADNVKVVSHLDRAWWSYRPPDGRGGLSVGPTPDEIKAQLEHGELEEVGRTDDEVHLRGRPGDKPGAHRLTTDLWVDASTFLPRRSVTKQPNGAEVGVRFTWMPRTEESAAQTRVTVPAGFRQLPGAPVR